MDIAADSLERLIYTVSSLAALFKGKGKVFTSHHHIYTQKCIRTSLFSYSFERSFAYQNTNHIVLSYIPDVVFRLRSNTSYVSNMINILCTPLQHDPIGIS